MGALFSFSGDLPPLIKTLDMMYASKSIELTQDIRLDNNYCPIDREDMLELLGNLLDNAYKWAKQKIIINVETGATLVITIEDDGPGADAEKISELAKRGVRLDEKTEGHGFGLAIANDIVTDYNGSMTFSQSSVTSGLKTEIKIPLK